MSVSVKVETRHRVWQKSYLNSVGADVVTALFTAIRERAIDGRVLITETPSGEDIDVSVWWREKV